MCLKEEKREDCASGSVVEYRLAKERVAGSNPVSRLREKDRKTLKRKGFPVFLCRYMGEKLGIERGRIMKGIRLIKKKWIWTLIIILYVGFIFHNSLTPANESSRQSGRVLEIILGFLEWTGLEGGWVTEHLVRKMAHFAEYTILGVLLGITLREYHINATLRRVLQWWMAGMIPLVDETLQLFTEGRSGQISDVWLDMAGACTGLFFIGIALWMSTVWRRRE